MANRFESIDDALDIESSPIDVKVEEVRKTSNQIIKENKKNKKSTQNEDIDLDYEYSRTNNYDLTSTINEVIYEMFEIAKNTQKARDFEVVGQLIKIAKEIDDGYLDRHQKIKRIKDEGSTKNQTVTTQTTNAVFVGSTAELQKFLKDNLKK